MNSPQVSLHPSRLPWFPSRIGSCSLGSHSPQSSTLPCPLWNWCLGFSLLHMGSSERAADSVSSKAQHLSGPRGKVSEYSSHAFRCVNGWMTNEIWVQLRGCPLLPKSFGLAWSPSFLAGSSQLRGVVAPGGGVAWFTSWRRVRQTSQVSREVRCGGRDGVRCG